MAFPHTNERFARVKEVYRNARPLSVQLPRPFRTEYQLRQGSFRSFSLYAPTLGGDDDSNPSDDDYVPETPRKRRGAASKPPPAKRAKSSTDQAKPPNAPPTPSQSVQTPTALDLEPFGDLNLQEDRASRRRPEPIKGYLDKQNEESEKISAGTTRSGLQRNMDGPVQYPGCATCKEDYKRCSARHTGVYPCERCQEYFFEGCSPIQKTKEPGGTSLPIHIGNASTAPLSQAENTPSSGVSNALPGIETTQRTMGLGFSSNNSSALNLRPTSSQSAANQGTFVINTVWAHPIDFKTTPDVCHFCRDFRYGLYGYGFVTAEVFRVNGEAGLQEAGEGHRSQGKEATRMCFRCAMRRLYVSRCEAHKLVRFMDPDAKRFAHYMAQLNADHLKGPFMQRGVYYTCWVCTQPAFFRCVAEKCRDIYGNSLEKMGKPKVYGCGAFFCESCANNIAADNGQLTKATVQKMGAQVPRRADLDFLFAGSLLHQAYK